MSQTWALPVHHHKVKQQIDIELELLFAQEPTLAEVIARGLGEETSRSAPCVIMVTLRSGREVVYLLDHGEYRRWRDNASRN